MFLTLAMVDALLLVATLLPLSRHPHFVVRGCDFPRLQIAIALCVMIAAQLAMGWWERPIEWVVLGGAMLGLLIQAWWVTPYSRIFPREVAAPETMAPDRSIRIITANVLQSNRRAEDLLTMVRDASPDVLIALETDDWWQSRLDALEAEGFTHTMKRPLDNLYGMTVYSRLPLHGTSIEYLAEDDVPSMHAMVELRSGEKVRLHVLHPAPPSPTENETSQERDAELIMVGKHVSELKRPAIVAGDLNDVAWSATTRLFRKLSGMLDPRVGRGMFSSFNAQVPFLRWPLDHLFHSAHFCLREIRRLPKFGSDHFPLLIHLQLDRTENDEGLSADDEERAWAEAKMNEADVAASEVPRPTGKS